MSADTNTDAKSSQQAGSQSSGSGQETWRAGREARVQISREKGSSK